MCYRISLILLLIVTKAQAQSYRALLKENYKVTVNYPDHSLTAFVNPVKNEVYPSPDKYYYWYSANDVKSTQGGYSGKLLNGTYADFYLNRNLKEKGAFKKGLRAGKWYAWTPDGTLKESLSWKTGTLNGPFYKYEKGELVEQGRFKNALLNGKVTKYHGHDSVNVSWYKSGKVVSKKKILPRFISDIFKKI